MTEKFKGGNPPPPNKKQNTRISILFKPTQVFTEFLFILFFNS